MVHVARTEHLLKLNTVISACAQPNEESLTTEDPSVPSLAYFLTKFVMIRLNDLNKVQDQICQITFDANLETNSLTYNITVNESELASEFRRQYDGQVFTSDQTVCAWML